MRTCRLMVLALLTSTAAASLSGCDDGAAAKTNAVAPGSGASNAVGGTNPEGSGTGSGTGDPNPIGPNNTGPNNTGPNNTDPNNTDPNNTNQSPDGGAGGSPGGGPVATSAEFEGVDLQALTLKPVPGCERGFDTSTGTLTLALGSDVHALVLDAGGDAIRANGVACTAADDSPARPSTIQKIVVKGSPEDDVVVFDMLPGDFGTSILGKSSSVVVDLATGNDLFSVRATRGDDALRCAGGSDEATNVIDLGTGSPSISVVSAESLIVSLGPGNDAFSGSVETACGLPLVVYGGSGSDTLQGGAKDDVLNGGDDSDTFEMGSSANGADVINGGPGDDYISYAKRLKAVAIKLCSADVQAACDSSTCPCSPENGEEGEKDTIVNVESAEGGEGNDTIVGDKNANALSGNGGDDDIQGGAECDQLYGNDGNDKLRGGDDDDILVGGAGQDLLDGQAGDNICLYDGADGPYVRCQTHVRTQQ